MEIQRTANAGVLLKMDGVSILLDGLADRVEGYLPTPPVIVRQLLDNPPDLLAFTHCHKDHCSEALLLPNRNQNLRPVFGPESLYLGRIQVGDVTITPVESRHLGKTEPGLQHISYIIQGSQCVWFTGDASPLQWKSRNDLPRPDVLIAPYAYGNTKAAWEISKSLANRIVLLHLPDKAEDVWGLWKSIEDVACKDPSTEFWIPEIGQWI